MLENFRKKKSEFKKNGKIFEKILKKNRKKSKKLEKVGRNQKKLKIFRFKIYFLQYLENGKR